MIAPGKGIWNYLLKIALLVIIMGFMFSCHTPKHKNKNGKAGIAEIPALFETSPVSHGEDAADDPAIWYNSMNPAESVIYGSDKQGGINAYNLNGDFLFYKEIGRINNIDVRYGFPLKSGKVDILGGSNRSDNTIVLYSIDPGSGNLENILAKPMLSGVNEVYGFALHHQPDSNIFYAFVNDKDGHVEQWELVPTDTGSVDAHVVRSFDVGGQTEGMVIDDYLGYLYIGEENKGVWKYHANPWLLHNRILLTDTSKKYIKEDIEGLCLYHADSINGYLIISVQGNSSFAVYERRGINQYIGSFRITDSGIDGVSETDGIEVLNLRLDANFPYGLFVAQDGFNHDGNQRKKQNFKLVSWLEIAGIFEPELLMSQDYFPY